MSLSLPPPCPLRWLFSCRQEKWDSDLSLTMLSGLMSFFVLDRTLTLASDFTVSLDLTW